MIDDKFYKLTYKFPRRQMEAPNCPVCLDLYDSPLLLNCLHSVCAPCLSALDAKTCPLCRLPFVEEQLIIDDVKTMEVAQYRAYREAEEEDLPIPIFHKTVLQHIKERQQLISLLDSLSLCTFRTCGDDELTVAKKFQVVQDKIVSAYDIKLANLTKSYMTIKGAPNDKVKQTGVISLCNLCPDFPGITSTFDLWIADKKKGVFTRKKSESV